MKTPESKIRPSRPIQPQLVDRQASRLSLGGGLWVSSPPFLARWRVRRSTTGIQARAQDRPEIKVNLTKLNGG